MNNNQQASQSNAQGIRLHRLAFPAESSPLKCLEEKFILMPKQRQDDFCKIVCKYKGLFYKSHLDRHRESGIHHFWLQHGAIFLYNPSLPITPIDLETQAAAPRTPSRAAPISNPENVQAFGDLDVGSETDSSTTLSFHTSRLSGSELARMYEAMEEPHYHAFQGLDMPIFDELGQVIPDAVPNIAVAENADIPFEPVAQGQENIVNNQQGNFEFQLREFLVQLPAPPHPPRNIINRLVRDPLMSLSKQLHLKYIVNNSNMTRENLEVFRKLVLNNEFDKYDTVSYDQLVKIRETIEMVDRDIKSNEERWATRKLEDVVENLLKKFSLEELNFLPTKNSQYIEIPQDGAKFQRRMYAPKSYTWYQVYLAVDGVTQSRTRHTLFVQDMIRIDEQEGEISGFYLNCQDGWFEEVVVIQKANGEKVEVELTGKTCMLLRGGAFRQECGGHPHVILPISLFTDDMGKQRGIVNHHEDIQISFVSIPPSKRYKKGNICIFVLGKGRRQECFEPLIKEILRQIRSFGTKLIMGKDGPINVSIPLFNIVGDYKRAHQLCNCSKSGGKYPCRRCYAKCTRPHTVVGVRNYRREIILLRSQLSIRPGLAQGRSFSADIRYPSYFDVNLDTPF